jgi:hypothetical protein
MVPLIVNVNIHGSVLSASRPGRCSPEERDLSKHCIGGWVGPRISLDVLETNLLPLQGFEPWIFHPVA